MELADGSVDLTCSARCTTYSIIAALREAEQRYPGGWAGGPECPAYQAAVAEVLLEQDRAQRRLTAARRRDAA
jgi:hypothetical protein